MKFSLLSLGLLAGVAVAVPTPTSEDAVPLVKRASLDDVSFAFCMRPYLAAHPFF